MDQAKQIIKQLHLTDQRFRNLSSLNARCERALASLCVRECFAKQAVILALLLFGEVRGGT